MSAGQNLLGHPPVACPRWWQRLFEFSRRQWLRYLLLIGFGMGTHAPALQGPFLWDDLYLARDNPFIKSPLLILEAFRHYLFPDTFFGHYRPVQTISYMFDYLVWNTDPCGYHLSNVLWHVAAGILLYRLLLEILGSASLCALEEKDGAAPPDRQSILSTAAFLIALLWVIHPVHSAAVDYISGRADSLAFFFACGGWLLYLRGRKAPRGIYRWSYYLLGASSAILSLCSRETGFIWMALFILYLFAFERKTALRRKLAALAFCLILVGLYGALRAMPEYRPVASNQHTPLSVKGTLMLRALGDYGRLMVWPSNLHMERDVTDPDSQRDIGRWRTTIHVEYLSLAGLLTGVVLLYGAMRRGRARSIRIFGASWFLVAYLPISNLFELNATVAEHWLYLPSVGFLIFVAGCFLELRRFPNWSVPILACLAVSGLAGRTFIRSTDWTSAETFYRRTLEAGATSLRICVNLALIYSNNGQKERAEKLLRTALKMNPDYLIARNNLANLLSQRGQKQEAQELLDSTPKPALASRALSPRPWVARLNLAAMARNQHDEQRAAAIADEVFREYPAIWEVVSYKAELTRKTCGPSAALPIIEGFAEEHWWHCDAFTALGKLLWESGNAGEAEWAFRHASWLDVHDSESLTALAILQLQENRLQAAFETQRRAVARQPQEMRPSLLFSDILQKMGRTTDAQVIRDRLTRLQSFAQAQPRFD